MNRLLFILVLSFSFCVEKEQQINEEAWINTMVEFQLLNAFISKSVVNNKESLRVAYLGQIEQNFGLDSTEFTRQTELLNEKPGNMVRLLDSVHTRLYRKKLAFPL